MSVSYDYFEKLQFNTTESNAEHVATIKNLLEDKLANMVVQMLYDTIGLHLYVNADGEEYYFSGESLSRYKDIFNAVRRASQLHITFSYWYEWYPSDMGLNVGPEVLTQFFEEASDELLEDTLYAYYVFDHSDGTINRGQLYAYRMKDGMVQKGEVELKEITALPESASWEISPLGVVIEDDFPGIDKQELVRIVNELVKLNDYTNQDLEESNRRYNELLQAIGTDTEGKTYNFHDLSMTGDTINFYVNNMSLGTPEQVHQYAALARELYFLLNQDENAEWIQPVPVEFYSEANEEPRILSIDVSGEDGYKMYMASLD